MAAGVSNRSVFRNTLGISPSETESFWNRDIPRDLSAAGGILLSRCINVTTLRGPSTRARLPMAFRCLSLFTAITFASSLRLSDSLPLSFAAANRLTHYFLHPFRSFTVNSCVKLIIHRWHWRLFTSRAPLGFRRLPPLSFLLSLLFFSLLLFGRFLLVFFFFFYLERIEFFSLGILIGRGNSEKNRSLDECWWDLTSGGGVGEEVEFSRRDFQVEKCKKEFLFCFLTRVFRERFDIAFGINLFLTKLLEGVGKVV